MTLDLQREAEKTRKEEEAFYRQQELMIGAEQQRRSMIMNEEKKLADQRTRYIFFFSFNQMTLFLVVLILKFISKLRFPINVQIPMFYSCNKHNMYYMYIQSI